MYAYFSGEVRFKTGDSVAIDVGGVGYEITMSSRSLDLIKIGERYTVLAHMHMVDSAATLYGFMSEDERSMFRKLISVSRVGPKIAIAALGVYKPADIALAIVSDDAKTLSRVPGLGNKTAQRVILELKDKVASDEFSFGAITGANDSEISAIGGARQEAILALVSLGYDRSTAAKAVSSSSGDKVEEIITQALKTMA